MKLKKYLKENKISCAKFGRAIGRTRAMIRLYCIGSYLPSGAMMKKISAVTKGAVRPEDFLNMKTKKIK